MPLTRQTLRLTDELRVMVNGTVGTATQALAVAWIRSWDVLAAAWSAAIAEVMDEIDAGQWPTGSQIGRLARVRDAMAMSVAELDRLADFSALTITDSAGNVVDAAGDWEARIFASQLPDGLDVAGEFDRLDPDALRAIVLRTTEQINAATFPLSNEAAEAMFRELVRGVALGSNPRVAAARMLAAVKGRFNGGLNRALTLARTEIVDAHRAAAEAHHKANADVIAGWLWKCAFSRRTCASCIAQHGSLHPVDEPGPLDHQNGRCVRVPKAKTWAELGIDLPERADVKFPDARGWFDGLPRDQQREIMGGARLDAYLSGAIDWGDMTAKRSTSGWRDSYGVPRLEKGLRRRRAA